MIEKRKKRVEEKKKKRDIERKKESDTDEEQQLEVKAKGYRVMHTERLRKHLEIQEKENKLKI